MILDDILTYVDAQSTALKKLAGSTGNLSVAFMPDGSPAPDTLVTLYETGGTAPTHVFSTGTTTRLFENPSIQALSRSSDYETARNNAETVFTILDGIGNTALPTSTGTLYLDITAIQSPFSIGRDDNGRFLVSVNFRVSKEVS